MTIFWILAAGLAGLAILYIVTPLVAKRESGPEVDPDQLNLEVFKQQLRELDADLEAENLDQTQYKAARRDLERELLYDVDGSGQPQGQVTGGGSPIVALLLAVALPAFAFSLYLYIGNLDIIPRLEMAAARQNVVPGEHPGAPGREELPSMDVLVERLAARMEQNPEQLDGWLMLGRSYFAVNQPEKALQALEKAYDLAPENPEVILAYAQAVATNAGGKLAGRPAELIGKALEIEPGNVTGRWLYGLITYQSGDYARSVERWETILADLDPAGEEAGELRQFIADARRRGGMETPDAPVTQAPEAPAGAAPIPAPAAQATAARQPVPAPAEAASGPSITVNVALAEPLWPEADVNHTLFVYAKAVSGPPMPLAVQRLRVADLPATVTLDDSMAMMPAMRISAFPEVTVGARISASGQATPGSGDLEGEVSPVKPSATGPIEVIIDRVRP